MKQEHNLSNNMILMSDASNLAAFLYRLKNHYPKNYREIVAVVQLIAPYFKDFVLKPQEYNAEQIILRWQKKVVRIFLMPFSFQMEHCALSVWRRF